MNNPIVNQIIDRQHVSLSNRGIIRAIYHGLSNLGREKEYRLTRKNFYRQALKRHADNKRLYFFVMGTRGA
jgi:hypothetical protein